MTARKNTHRTDPADERGDFFSSEPTIEELAAAQGVSPVTDFEKLLGNFWPEDETADDFLEARRRWRRETCSEEQTESTR